MIGYCDVPDGCEFITARDMFEAKVFDGLSLHDRWYETVIVSIGGISVDELEFLKMALVNNDSSVI